ncbi:MAG: hypothetical protein J6R25_01730 [Bacteroidales bacterium]|nr:hypothetical protein [Bacteroidales bacterium]MBO7321715.1 hypothetical protein [Bacteroidales bacterium]
MNIIVSPYGKESFYCRPDSTLIRALDEYYIPDQVEKVSAVPVMYIKTLRAGKAIANRFAQRYIDSYGFGLLLHPTLKGEYFSDLQERAFIENSLDYTSIIPLLSFPEMEIPAATTHKFEVQINYANPFEAFTFPTYDGIMERIALISRYCSLRIGDFITMELAKPVEITPVSRLTGSVDGQQIFNFVVK